ncbi:MAG: exo-alpha-sialidase, partial [Armatimonadetes bacterium]|nr:exo-alpha-sialidase [Armatimonadota bacterium]
VRSDDWGTTWSAPTYLTTSGAWHQAPCNVWYAHGKVYLVMEHNTDPHFRGWAVSRLAPVVMAARVDDDLTRPEAWTFSNELSFNQALEEYARPQMIGVPFFRPGPQAPRNPGDRRYMNLIGWLETNIVQITDPDHVWYDPSGRSFLLLARAHTGSTNLACLARAVEAEDGSLTVSLQRAPSGEPILYVPLPGGHLKFHIVYDDRLRLYWLVSNQSTDSMTRPDRLPRDRFNLPNNERNRLALYFSRNCVDWCFAGMVAIGATPKESRHYASMVIDGNDLLVLSRSGDAQACSAHDGDLITLHRVRNFRSLVY